MCLRKKEWGSGKILLLKILETVEMKHY